LSRVIDDFSKDVIRPLHLVDIITAATRQPARR